MSCVLSGVDNGMSRIEKSRRGTSMYIERKNKVKEMHCGQLPPKRRVAL